MQYTEKELSQLINDLEVEFTSHLAKAELSVAQNTSLAKAEDEKPAFPPKKEAADKEDSKPEAKESDEKPEAAESAAEEKQEGEAPAAPGKEEPAVPAAPVEGGVYDAEDIAHLDQMYMSMSKEELLIHHDSCVRALDAIGAEHVHANPAAPVAPEAPAAAPVAPEAPPIDKACMNKSENIELELAKSEAISNKSKAEELQKSLDTVQEFLTKLIKKVPQGKAVTSLDQISKSEDSAEEKVLTKNEINSILLQKTADPKLNKNDRDAINAYYLNNSNLKTINHLLK